ncbi:carboxypeptidase-like regulatory domain-containing protein [Halomarina rubra]|uniref:Carboxypeptidase-like regulatory domain-containing protein n=1 Tax=Halomarina rubra TaxID=2071873 RepID=A0ABD6AUH9_9EURY|nr:carboxypeptidase-like regulatory domain-containing protein [Halomarina rubra]
MRTKYVPFVALLVVLSVVAPTAMAAPQQQVTLTVTVVDQSGDSVGGATLTASWDGGEATETTRSNGQALVDVPQGADVSLDVEDDEYVRNVPKVVSSADGGDVTVEVAKKGSATVRVEAEQGGALSGATVTLSRDGDTVAEGTTNDNGGFRAQDIERGEYTVEVVKPGYYATERSLTLQQSFAIQTVAVEEGRVTARFGVVDDHFEEPPVLSGATVKVGSLGQFNTSDDGTRAIEVPVNAQFEVRVSKPGYQTTTQTVTIGESDETTVLGIQRTPTLTVDPANTQVVVNQTVEVQVTDEYDETVANATLQVDGEAVGTTDAQGRVRIPIDSDGEHDVTALKDGVTSDPIVVEGVARAQQTQQSTMTGTAAPEPTASETASETTTESSGTGPGFTSVAALLALLAVTALTAVRRTQ